MMPGPWLIPVQLALALVQVSPALMIDSDSSCPSADMVAGELATLAQPPVHLRLSVMVRGSADRLALEFSWPENPVPEVRELAAAGDCAARARSAAVSLASWIGLFAPDAPSAPMVQRREVPAPPPPPPPAAMPPPPRTWLGAGLYAGISAGLVPGLSITAERLRAGAGWRIGGRLAALASAPQSEMIGGAKSAWLRPALFAGAVAARNLGPVDAVVAFGVVGGVTFAWGSGYSVDKSTSAFGGGGAGALRIGSAGTGRIIPWLEVTAIRWLGTQRLRVDAAAVGLPQWEALVSIGWSIGL